MFFGTVVAPGKATPVVPHADGFALHLSQVALPSDVPVKARVSLLIKVGDEEPIVLCTLTAGVRDTVLLDQFLTEYAELTVSGGGPVHVTGYYSPSFGGPDEEDEDEEDDDYGVPGGGHPLQHLLGHLHPDDLMDGGEDEDEDEDEDDEDEDGSDDDLEAGPGQQREPSVIIEDVTEQQPAKPAVKALPPAADSKAADKKRKAAEPDAASAKKQAVQPAKEGQKQKKQEQQPEQQPQAQQKKQQAADAKQQKQQQQAKQQKQQDEASPSTAAGVVSAKKGVKRYENGFEVHNVAMGDPHGKLAKAGKVVKVRYTGRLTNGKVFDKTTHKPFAFRLGVGDVIKGWDAGVEGMRVGDKRKLVIPPVMGYGSTRPGPIPPNSTLEFDVELVDVK